MSKSTSNNDASSGVVMFDHDNGNNLRAVVTDIIVKAKSSDRMHAVLLGFNQYRSFRPVSSADFKLLEDTALSSTAAEEDIQEAVEILAAGYVLDIEVILTTTPAAVTTLQRFKLSGKGQAATAQCTKALNIVSAQYNKMENEQKPKHLTGTKKDTIMTVTELDAKMKVKLFQEAWESSAAYIYAGLIQRVEQSYHSSLTPDGWSALAEIQSWQKPAKLAQITKVMSCAFKVKEASVMADGRKFRSLHDQAAIDIPELSNMTALDLLELFMADKMLRNMLDRCPVSAAKVMELYDEDIDEVSIEDTEKELNSIEQTNKYVNGGKNVSALFGADSNTNQAMYTDNNKQNAWQKQGRQNQNSNNNNKNFNNKNSYSNRQNSNNNNANNNTNNNGNNYNRNNNNRNSNSNGYNRNRLTDDEFKSMRNIYQSTLEQQSKLTPLPSQAEAHRIASNAPGSVSTYMRPLGWAKYRYSHMYPQQWPDHLKNAKWSQSSSSSTKNNDYNQLKKKFDTMSNQMANLSTTLQNAGLVERE